MARAPVVAIVLTALIVTGATTPCALAHKVVAGAYATGDAIEGEIGFSDGVMAKNIDVAVFTEAGEKLGAIKTDEHGVFRFVPTRPVTHVFKADLGAGHVAEVRVAREDLPAALAGVQPRVPLGEEASVVAGSPPVTTAALSLDAQRALVAEAVRAEIAPLRRELIALREKTDLQAVLGGIGYIIGLFGLWFFWAARRRKAAG
jgi:nickel transport protein